MQFAVCGVRHCSQTHDWKLMDSLVVFIVGKTKTEQSLKRKTCHLH